MSKKVAKILLEGVLAKAPHRQTISIGSTGFQGFQSKTKALDDAYLDDKLGEIYCDFLTKPEFTYFKTAPQKIQTFGTELQQLIQRQRVSKEQAECQSKQIEEMLMEVTKKLMLNKNSMQAYFEAEKLISNLSAEQALEHKQYLMRIYRWTSNQSSSRNLHIANVVQELKQTAVKKLCTAYESTPENKQIEKQLSRIESLSKARELSLIGEREKAKNMYQRVLLNQSNQEAVRREALDFICQESLTTGDVDYLVHVKNCLSEDQDGTNIAVIENALWQLFLGEEHRCYPENFKENTK